MSDDTRFMHEALALAREAADRGEVPVGAVIVRAGLVVGRGFNEREASGDPTAHAEMIALRAAARQVGGWRLDGATAYVTLEPCPMCAGALVNARVERVVYGCDDPKAGAVRTLYAIGVDGRLNHRFDLTRGVLEDECAALLSDFFSRLRQNGRA